MGGASGEALHAVPASVPHSDSGSASRCCVHVIRCTAPREARALAHSCIRCRLVSCSSFPYLCAACARSPCARGCGLTSAARRHTLARSITRFDTHALATRGTMAAPLTREQKLAFNELVRGANEQLAAGAQRAPRLFFCVPRDPPTSLDDDRYTLDYHSPHTPASSFPASHQRTHARAFQATPRQH